MSHPPPYPPPYPQPVRPRTTNGLAIAALVLGVITVLVCWIPYVGLLGAVTGLVGSGLGIAGLVTSRRLRTGAVMASFGLGMSALGAIAAVVITIVFTRALFEGDLNNDDVPEASAGIGEWVTVGDLELRVISVGKCEADGGILGNADCPLDIEVRNTSAEPAYVNGDTVVAVVGSDFQDVDLLPDATGKDVYRIAPGAGQQIEANINTGDASNVIRAVVFFEDSSRTGGVTVSLD